MLTDKKGMEYIAHIQLANAETDVNNNEGEIIFEPLTKNDDELFSFIIID